jgi:HAD superfamily hydrolase (TIGR01549 family)
MSQALVPVRAVLFDLGGVLLDVDLQRSFDAWSRHSRLSREELQAAFRFDDPFQRHETGALSPDGYFAHLREALALEGDTAAVQAGFNAMLAAEIAETVDLLEAIRNRVPCYAISNTNPVHLAEIERAFPRLLPRFTRVFTSHEIGHRKPHAAAFEHVLREIGLPAAQVLLFDDLVTNIEAARALGLQAVLVRSPADVREGLAARGLPGV